MHHRSNFLRRTPVHRDNGGFATPLSELSSGESGTICNLCGGRGFKSRLTTLGFTIGAEVTVVRNIGHGPVIVSLLDTQIALGYLEANRIEVLTK